MAAELFDMTEDQRPVAICVMGPTAAGKTDLAIALHKQLGCELISVDSALVFRGMDIGTAKPSAAELQVAPHRLIDIIEPTEAYSAARFRKEALAEMDKISIAGSIPLLVGGTMLYFRALENGLADLPESDPKIRAQLDAQAAELGWAAMHQRLSEVDPASALRIHPNDPQRIQRALEVYQISGQTMTELHAAAQDQQLPYRLIKLTVAPEDRSVLHQRIEMRFKQMLENGFIDEVKALRARGDLSLNMPSMRAVGYRQVWEYLDGQYDYEEMVFKGVVATRQFAKRQFTWLRADKEAVWFESETKDLLAQVLKYLTTTPRLSG